MTSKIKILIVEDDPIIAEDLQAYMLEFGYDAIAPVDNADDALKAIRVHQPDLCILDIHLNSEIDGIQLAGMINEKIRIPIIFLTAFNDSDTIERIKAVGPAAYLVKPVDERNLQAAVELAFSNFHSVQKNVGDASSVKPIDSIFIKIKDKLTKFILDDISYFEAFDNYAFLHTLSGKHILSASLKQVEERLPESQFIRTHRSYIVNLHKIEGIGTNYLLVGKKEIPIGKTFRESLMKRIELL